MDKKYLRFYLKDTKKHIRKNIRSKEFSGDDFFETGYLLLIGVTKLEVDVCWNKLDLFFLGLDDEFIERFEGEIENLKDSYSTAMNKYHERKNSVNEPKINILK